MTLPNVNDQFADLVMTHAVDLERFTTDVKNRVVAELRSLERELVLRLNVVDPTAPTLTVYKRARLEALLKQTRDTIRSAYSNINQIVRKDSNSVAAIESEFTAKAIDGVIGVSVNSVALSAEQLRAYTSNILIDGAKSSVWWARQSADLQNKFSNQMRQGMQMGEPLNDLVRRVRGRRENGFRDGIMQTATHRAKSLARTSVQAAANVAVEETLLANDDVVKGFQWVSTLDGRTTPICIARDGKMYDLNKKPIEHELPWLEGPGRIHWGCRSTMVPILKSWKELSHSGAVRTGGRPTNIQGVFENRLGEMGMSTEEIAAVKVNARASMTGQVADSLTYEGWLREKSPAFQNRILGRERAEMWRQGRIAAADLVSQDGRALTLDQLRAMSKSLADIDLEAKALQAARYDPTVMKTSEVERRLQAVRFTPTPPTSRAGMGPTVKKPATSGPFGPMGSVKTPAPVGMSTANRKAAALQTMAPAKTASFPKPASGKVLTKTTGGGFRLREPVPSAKPVLPTPTPTPTPSGAPGAASAVPRPGSPKPTPKPDLVYTMEGGTPASMKELGGAEKGINTTLIVELKESHPATGNPLKGVFKPMEGEEFLGVRETVVNEETPLAYREVMAYQVDQIAGFNMCPETVLREMEYKLGNDTMKGLGSFQRFVDGAEVQARYMGRDMTPAENYRLSLFDYLIGNTDRHGKNYMRLKSTGAPIPIDHGYSFPANVTKGGEGLKEFRSQPYANIWQLSNKKNLIPDTERKMYADRLREFLKGTAEAHEGIPAGLDEFAKTWKMSPQEADAFKVRVEKAIDMLEKDTFHVRARRYTGWGLES